MERVPIIGGRNGTVQLRRSGRHTAVIAADLPTTRLPPVLVPAVGDLTSLQMLDLCGRHLPTDVLCGDDVRAFSELQGLTVQGNFLEPQQLAGLLRKLNKLRSLNLAGCAVDAAVLNAVASLPLLEELTLGIRRVDAEAHRYIPPPIADADLALVAHCAALRKLGLRGRPVGPGALAAIATLPYLSWLDLGETNLTDAGFALLTNAGALRALDVDRTRIGDDSTGQLLRMGIERLDISGTAFGNQGLAVLLSRQHWRALSLAGIDLAETTLQLLRRLTDLDTLVMDTIHASVLFEDAPVFPHFSSLKLQQATGDASLVRMIANACPRLRHLGLGGITQDGLVALGKMTSLESVSLAMDEPGPEEWAALSMLAGVRDLDAVGDTLDGDLPPGIVNLRLGGHMPSAAMAAILRCQALETLTLDDATLMGMDTDQAAAVLPRLRNVIAERAQLGDAGLARLATLLQCEALYISGNPLTEIGIAALAGHPLLHTLEIRDCELGDTIIPTLMTLPRLHCLDIAGSAVTAAGLAALASGPNMQSLGIDGCQFDDAAAIALSGAALLTELYLYPPFGLDAMRRLPMLTQVREIRLMDTPILVPEAVDAFAAMLSLRSIGGNGASAEVITLLREKRPDLRVRLDVWEPPAQASAMSRLTQP